MVPKTSTRSKYKSRVSKKTNKVSGKNNIKKTKFFKMYKLTESHARKVSRKKYDDFKRCSQKNCKDRFDDLIIVMDKTLEKNTKEMEAESKKIFRKLEKKHKYDSKKMEPKSKTNKFLSDYFKELIKFGKKHQIEKKKLQKPLLDCQKKHCNAERKTLEEVMKANQDKFIKLVMKSVKSGKYDMKAKHSKKTGKK